MFPVCTTNGYPDSHDAAHRGLNGVCPRCARTGELFQYSCASHTSKRKMYGTPSAARCLARYYLSHALQSDADIHHALAILWAFAHKFQAITIAIAIANDRACANGLS